MSAQGWAMWLWHRGLSVVPVPRPSWHHDGKRPIIAWREFQERRPAEVQIRRWFSADSNLAVVTGAVSGVVVVDADSKEAVAWVRAQLPRTPWIVATSRGFHLYYRHPGEKVPNRAKIDAGDGRLALDVRGDGGYVIGPGSVHASGTFYRAIGDWSAPSADLPVVPPAMLKRSEARPPRPPARVPQGGAAARARKYLSRIPQPIEGQGSDAATFYAACRLVRGFGLNASDAVEILCAWAPADFDRWWIERKVDSAIRYGAGEIGGLLQPSPSRMITQQQNDPQGPKAQAQRPGQRAVRVTLEEGPRRPALGESLRLPTGSGPRE